MEGSTFIERVLLKKYTHFYTITYNGENLRIEPTIPYHQLIEFIHESRA